ncbi:hypothetical protein [Falsibacillus pallidus]|uniref:Uncharacterized protein n=1 Tax=Falsibacillus pallidus TaxID=493781 RepID=A0A370G401_9BACI|nr:hypothetical protein [Falsibacillus pallidus]RDI38475.1 hypothetical protein DFR59_11716 [Falsibacillus pallidus]
MGMQRVEKLGYISYLHRLYAPEIAAYEPFHWFYARKIAGYARYKAAYAPNSPFYARAAVWEVNSKGKTRSFDKNRGVPVLPLQPRQPPIFKKNFSNL